MDTIRIEPAPPGIHVSGPDTHESHWQPVPANGHFDVAPAPHIVGMEQPFAHGTQSVAPGGYVREHTHDHNEEAVYVVEGRGRAVIDGKEYPLGRDSVVFLPKNTATCSSMMAMRACAGSG